MRINPLKRLWAAGGVAVNGWLAIPSSFAAETMAHGGWDSLTLDLQHGLLDYSSALPLLQAISTTPVVPMARIPWLDEAIIMKMLDTGAQGLICPMIEDAADAARFVDAALYPPAGKRSFGPVRATLYSGADYGAHANDEMALFAMIETRNAVANLDAILAVKGLTGVYIGPADLGAAFGHPPKFDREEPELLEMIEMIATKTRARGLVAGIHTGSTAYALRMARAGFQLVTVGSDARYIAAGAAQTVAEMRVGLA